MRKVLALFTCLLWIGVCEGTTYYMRADGTAANKSAATSCSSAATAMSCSTHNSQTFSGDDVIKLCDDGGTYSCTLTPPSSGASGHPITYKAQTGDSPVINGAGRQFGISISKAYIVLDGLTVQNSQSEGILVTNHNVTVQNCIVHDCGATNNKIGLSFWGSSGGEVYNGTIRNCIAYNNYASGIFMGAAHDYAPYNGLIENCISYNNGHNIDADHGIYVKYGVTVKNCTVYDNHCGGGIKANDESSPYPGRVSIIAHNLSYDNRYGIVSTSTGATYRDNILRENDRYNIMDLASANSYFYNNTLYNSAWHGICFYYPASGNTFKNNTIYESANGLYYTLYVNNNKESPGNSIDAIAANNTFDYNLYYTGKRHFIRDWKDINSPPGVKYTFTQWKGLTGSPDAHSQLIDPAFYHAVPEPPQKLHLTLSP